MECCQVNLNMMLTLAKILFCVLALMQQLHPAILSYCRHLFRWASVFCLYLFLSLPGCQLTMVTTVKRSVPLLVRSQKTMTWWENDLHKLLYTPVIYSHSLIGQGSSFVWFSNIFFRAWRAGPLPSPCLQMTMTTMTVAGSTEMMIQRDSSLDMKFTDMVEKSTSWLFEQRRGWIAH